MEELKTINIFLTGGGFKGSFQAGFLYTFGKWLDNNNNKYKIGKIYGSSIGSINGFIFLDDYNKLVNFWKSIKSFKSMVSYWSNIPIIGPIISFIYGIFFKYCIINTKKFTDLINMYCSSKKNNVNVNKLNICTTNITDAKIEYIDCSSETLQIDHIIASSSLWLFSMPKKINNKYFMDGGLFKYLPINDAIINNFCNDINIVISNAKNIERPNSNILGSNLIFYLNNLLHMICDMLYETDIDKIKNLTNYKCFYIKQQLLQNVDTTSFNHDDIQKLWDNGIEECNNFIISLNT